MILALEMYRSLPRYIAVTGARLPDARSCSPDRSRRCGWSTARSPEPAHSGWARVRTRLSGICGSDLGAVTGSHVSLYFSALVSMPFVPGHEVVGELLDDCDDLPVGTRVVLDPVLSCAARGVEPCTGAPPAPPTAATGSPSATSPRGCRPASAPTPAAAGAVADGSPLPAARGPRRPARRAGRAGRAARLRGPHRTAARACPQATRSRLGRRRGRPVHDARPARAHRRGARSPSSPSTGASAELARRFGATDVVAPSEVVPAIRAPDHAAVRGSTPEYGGAVPARRSRRRHRRGRLQAVARHALRATRAGGRVVLVRDAGAGRRPVAGVVPRARGDRLLRLGRREPAAGDGRPSTSRWSWPPPAPLDGVVAATYPLHRLARGARPRAVGRPPRHGQGGLRPEQGEAA